MREENYFMHIKARNPPHNRDKIKIRQNVFVFLLSWSYLNSVDGFT